MWRARRVKKDREAGLVFDWRSGHGSARRLLIAAVISVSFWGSLFSYVQFRTPVTSPLVDQQIDLALLDLGFEENRWFADLIERETLFYDRWDVSTSLALDEEISRALAATPVAIFDPRVHEISPPEPDLSAPALPGMGPDVLPPPREVDLPDLALPPANWWIAIEPIEGGTDWKGLEFPWPRSDDPGKKNTMSEGESWTVTLALDWKGRVIVCEAWEEVDDERTPLILSKIREAAFPALESEGPLRWWKLQARIVNKLLAE